MAQVPTVRISDPKKPGDFVIINESRFDADKHTLFVENQKPAPDKAEAPSGDAVTDPIEDDLFASNAAEDLAREHGIDVDDIPATGKNGKILTGDVQAAIDARAE